MTELLNAIDGVVAEWEAQPEAWNPGDPLYDRPRGHFLGEQTVRPMIQLLAAGDDLWARCEPCQVSWAGASACWVCGETPPRPVLNGHAATVVAFDEITNYHPRTLCALQPVMSRSSMLSHPRQSGLTSFLARVVADAAQVVEAMESVRFTLDQFVGLTAEDVRRFERRVDRHHPRPLPIDGRAYHQRQRNRRRSR